MDYFLLRFIRSSFTALTWVDDGRSSLPFKSGEGDSTPSGRFSEKPQLTHSLNNTPSNSLTIIRSNSPQPVHTAPAMNRDRFDSSLSSINLVP